MLTPLKETLARALEKNGYHFSADTQQQLIDYLTLLEKWNAVYNLTAIHLPQDQITLHILDSLAIYPYLHGKRMLDVGSGGGLPGIPLAIMDTSNTWVLLDKSQKKTRFLVQVVAELGLKNVTVVCSRCEDFQTPSYFDSIISRAFGTIRLFLENTAHLLDKNGYFLAMKGLYPKEEIAEIPSAFHVHDVQKLAIQGLHAERHLVRVQKI